MAISDQNRVFPAFLCLQGRACLLVGSGAEAVVKGRLLLEAGARLTIVSATLDPAFREEVQRGAVVWRDEPFQPDHLEGIWFAVSALSDETENARIFAEAERRRIFLNVVDRIQYCSMYWPAVISRPPVMAAFTTSGSSPALAGYLRRKMASVLPENIGLLARWLAEWRQKTNPRLPALQERIRFWRNLFDGGLAERFLSGDEKGAESMIGQAMEEEISSRTGQ